MRMMPAEEERRLTLLEMQVGALLQQREHLTARVMRLREYIAANCPHSPFPEDCEDDDCPTCSFLKDEQQ